jgi:uncharacterized protein (TIGR03083 family)
VHPSDIATTIRRLRAASIDLFDDLSETELEVEALPGWTVLDVFRHLADSDRGSVLGVHLRQFLPGKDLDAFERINDAELERLRQVGRAEVREELQRWGSRLATVVGVVPPVVGRVPLPTAFGRVPVAWMGALRPYDEWVHQWDVTHALGRDEPPMDPAARSILAEFHLRALPARPLRELTHDRGVVELVFRDAGVPAWRFDLAGQRFGAAVPAAPTVTVTSDVPSWCLVAADRTPWRDLDGVTVEGQDVAAATALLDVVRVV